jgi:hypothetical protein
MKKLILPFSFLLTLSAKAQTNVYHPLLDSGALWNVYWQFEESGPAGHCYQNTNYSYHIEGDTLINTKIYWKVHSPYCDSDAVNSCAIRPYCPGYYSGALREDTTLRKVWFVSPDSINEYLLYDFSLKVGDSINWNSSKCNYADQVIGIYPILIGNSYRKQWEFNIYSPVIEGIGSVRGLLESTCNACIIGAGECTLLECFQQDGRALYPDTNSSCNLITQIKITHKNSVITLSPNPFHTTATLSLNNFRITS